MSNILDEIERRFQRETPLPEFHVGDTVDVHVRIKEGDKERIQVFTGTVIKNQNRKNLRGTFTVRRIVSGEGVERTFPYHSPVIQTVIVRRKGKVRRAKLFYLRERIGKATRVKERRDDAHRAKGKKGQAAAKGRARKKQEAAEPEASSEPSEAAASVG